MEELLAEEDRLSLSGPSVGVDRGFRVRFGGLGFRG